MIYITYSTMVDVVSEVRLLEYNWHRFDDTDQARLRRIVSAFGNDAGCAPTCLARMILMNQILTTDQVIGFAAAVVALVALGVAVWEGVMARRHNRLSVMPLLTIRHHLAGSLGALGLTASNDGLGPALVTKCVLEVDGAPMKEEGDNGWESAITVLGLRELKLRYTIIAPSEVIRPGDTIWLVATEVVEGHIAKLSGAFYRLNVRVSYESMYRDRKVATYQG